jgi:hypothetical protein
MKGKTKKRGRKLKEMGTGNISAGKGMTAKSNEICHIK